MTNEGESDNFGGQPNLIIVSENSSVNQIKDNKHNFEADEVSDFYLSLINPAFHSAVVNRALHQLLLKEAEIDMGDSRGVVNFWRQTNQKKKALVCKQLYKGKGQATDIEIWNMVIDKAPQDFFVMAARYLTLHKAKYGEPWKLPPDEEFDHRGRASQSD